jgi:hypothetical protein
MEDIAEVGQSGKVTSQEDIKEWEIEVKTERKMVLEF